MVVPHAPDCMRTFTVHLVDCPLHEPVTALRGPAWWWRNSGWSAVPRNRRGSDKLCALAEPYLRLIDGDEDVALWKALHFGL